MLRRVSVKQFHQSMNAAVVVACVVLYCVVCIHCHCTGLTSLCSPNYSVTEAAARYTAFVGAATLLIAYMNISNML